MSIAPCVMTSIVKIIAAPYVTHYRQTYITCLKTRSPRINVCPGGYMSTAFVTTPLAGPTSNNTTPEPVTAPTTNQAALPKTEFILFPRLFRPAPARNCAPINPPITPIQNAPPALQSPIDTPIPALVNPLQGPIPALLNPIPAPIPTPITYPQVMPNGEINLGSNLSAISGLQLEQGTGRNWQQRSRTSAELQSYFAPSGPDATNRVHLDGFCHIERRADGNFVLRMDHSAATARATITVNPGTPGAIQINGNGAGSTVQAMPPTIAAPQQITPPPLTAPQTGPASTPPISLLLALPLESFNYAQFGANEDDARARGLPGYWGSRTDASEYSRLYWFNAQGVGQHIGTQWNNQVEANGSGVNLINIAPINQPGGVETFGRIYIANAEFRQSGTGTVTRAGEGGHEWQIRTGWAHLPIPDAHLYRAHFIPDGFTADNRQLYRAHGGHATFEGMRFVTSPSLGEGCFEAYTAPERPALSANPTPAPQTITLGSGTNQVQVSIVTHEGRQYVATDEGRLLHPIRPGATFQPRPILAAVGDGILSTNNAIELDIRDGSVDGGHGPGALSQHFLVVTRRDDGTPRLRFANTRYDWASSRENGNVTNYLRFADLPVGGSGSEFYVPSAPQGPQIDLNGALNSLRGVLNRANSDLRNGLNQSLDTARNGAARTLQQNLIPLANQATQIANQFTRRLAAMIPPARTPALRDIGPSRTVSSPPPLNHPYTRPTNTARNLPISNQPISNQPVLVQQQRNVTSRSQATNTAPAIIDPLDNLRTVADAGRGIGRSLANAGLEIGRLLVANGPTLPTPNEIHEHAIRAFATMAPPPRTAAPSPAPALTTSTPRLLAGLPQAPTIRPIALSFPDMPLITDNGDPHRSPPALNDTNPTRMVNASPTPPPPNNSGTQPALGDGQESTLPGPVPPVPPRQIPIEFRPFLSLASPGQSLNNLGYLPPTSSTSTMSLIPGLPNHAVNQFAQSAYNELQSILTRQEVANLRNVPATSTEHANLLRAQNEVDERANQVATIRAAWDVAMVERARLSQTTAPLPSIWFPGDRIPQLDGLIIQDFYVAPLTTPPAPSNLPSSGNEVP